jgi:hypothetical protein
MSTLLWDGLDLEGGPSDSTLSNDGLQRSNFQFGMIRDWNGYGAEFSLPLHDNVTSALADNLKPMLFEDSTSLSSRQDAEFTHGPLRSG